LPHHKKDLLRSDPEPSRKHKNLQKTASKRIDVEFEGNQDDFREYVEELAGEGEISPEEYEVILENIGR